MENRQGTGSDAYLSSGGKGLIIWHLNKSYGTYNTFGGMDVEIATAIGTHGQDWLDNGVGSGESRGFTTDFFNPTNKSQFTPWTNPSTETGYRFFDSHTPSGIAMTNISYGSGTSIEFDLIENFTSGEITENSWWEGTETITGDITIASGVNLTVEENTTVNFSATSDDKSGGAYSTKAELIVNGTLTADGSLDQITFNRSGASGTWGGIRFNSGSSGTITYATIDHATKGIYVSGTNNVTVANCTIQNFSEQGVYASNSSVTVENSTIQNPAGASHGIYLLGGSSDPMISGNTVKDVVIGIERKDSPGAATISDNTFLRCRDGVKTYLSSPEIYNNYFDGAESSDHGIRLAASSSPDIHDNDFFDNSAGVYLDQSEPSDLKWNNFGYSGGQTQYNEDKGLYINYLTSDNSFADNKWNNFYDGNEVPDVFNSTAFTLKARGNYWNAQSIEGSVDSSNPQTSHNSNAGPGGSLGKLAQREFEEDTRMASTVPEDFGLAQNFPNPFNPSTVISFGLPEAANVMLTIYDILGRRVQTLVSNTSYSAGIHKLSWDGRDDAGKSLASGLYVYRLKAKTQSSQKIFSESRKMVFIQ